jgi:hypothetical protein
MGFIRGALVTLFSIILFFSLFLMSFSAILSSSLQHDVLQPVLKTSVSEILRGSLGGGSMFTEQEKAQMQNACLIQEEYTLSYSGYTSVIPCEIIQQGEDAIINYEAENLVNNIYYTEYNCEFWECVDASIKSSSIPFVLISEKAREYWTKNFFILLGLSILIFAVIFMISRNRPGVFITGGVLLILSALPFRILNWLLGLLGGVIPSEFSGIFSVFFTKAYSVFKIILIIGIVFIIFGVLCKIFGWKMRFGKSSEESSEKSEKPKKEKEVFTKSEVRKIVKEELSKKSVSKPKSKPKKKK